MGNKYRCEHFTESTQLTTAAELWEKLSPVNIPKENEYIYRGQANANWSLTPSSLRKTYLKDSRSWIEVLQKESGDLKNFSKFCNSAGIELPPGTTLPENHWDNPLSSIMDVEVNNDASKWPGDDLLPLIAMAQHHGVATRLLDWTRNPYIAAYFAASSALDRLEQEDFLGSCLAVWVLNRTVSASYKLAELHEEASHWSPHISAQSGLFSVSRTQGSRDGGFTFRSLDEAINAIHLQNKPEIPLLTKYTLPVAEATNLLDLCEKVNINAATVYRSADGAGKAVKDQNNKASASNLFSESRS